MYDTYIWERYYLTRTIVLFLKQYTGTLLFKISSPLSSVFWILSSIVAKTWTAELQWFAIFVLIAPATYFAFMFRPFNVRVKWEQLKPNGNIAERANHRNHVYIDGENKAEIRVTVLFDSSVSSYRLQFDADHPLEAYPGSSAPDNSDYDEETNSLYAEEVDNVKFFFTLHIESDRDDLNIHNPTVKIKDANQYDLGILEYLPDRILRLLKRDPILVKLSLY